MGGAAAALLAAGCVSSDLSKDAETTEEVVECLPTNAPAPTVVARAIWYPHASGFGSAEAHETGVLVLAGRRLWFMEWNGPGHHFEVERVIDAVQAVSIGVSRFGTSAMLVIQSGNLSFDSFELMNGGELGSDPQATQALYQRIQALRAG
jgi:hypothetical protein